MIAHEVGHRVKNQLGITGRAAQQRFTHGSSAQGVRWLRTGLESGDVNECTTFEAARQ